MIDPSNYYLFRNGFSESEIENIEQLVKDLAEENGTAGGVVDLEYRNSYVRWIRKAKHNEWLFKKIQNYVLEANSIWNFSLTGHDIIQYGEYRNGHYDWHLDFGKSCANRKISVTIQLNDDYDGGELLIMNANNPQIVPKGKGNVCIFPSYLLHKVQQVQGIRKSLVCWIQGPPFT